MIMGKAVHAAVNAVTLRSSQGHKENPDILVSQCSFLPSSQSWKSRQKYGSEFWLYLNAGACNVKKNYLLSPVSSPVHCLNCI